MKKPYAITLAHRAIRHELAQLPHLTEQIQTTYRVDRHETALMHSRKLLSIAENITPNSP
jgi:hypothetical protein